MVQLLRAVRYMSPTDNEIHLVLVTCYNIFKRHSLEDQLRAACLVMKYIIYHDKVAVSRSDRLSPPMRHSRNVYSQPYQVSLCKTQQRKASFFPHSIVDWNRIPQTAVLSDSVESFRPDCDYFI